MFFDLTGRRMTDRPPIMILVCTHPAVGLSSVVGRILRVQRFLTRLPFCLAETAGLQCLNHSKRFFSRTSDIQIVNDLVTKNAFRIDNEESAKCDTAVFDQHAIVARDILGRIRGQRIFQILRLRPCRAAS